MRLSSGIVIHCSVRSFVLLCKRLGCDVSVTTPICTSRVRLQKGRMDKRQKNHAKFLEKWYFQKYASEGERAAQAKEVIEAVI